MKKLSVLLMLLLLWSGCVQNIQNIQSISSKGVTLRIPAYELNSHMQDLFPIISNLQYGSIELSNPKAILKKGSNKIIAGTSISYQNDNLPTQTGKLYISGSPYFDAVSGDIYLHSPKIEKLSFNGIDLFDYVKKPIIEAIQPNIDNIFAQYPIYKIDRSSFANSFIKDLYIEDGSLLVTFGL